MIEKFGLTHLAHNVGHLFYTRSFPLEDFSNPGHFIFFSDFVINQPSPTTMECSKMFCTSYPMLLLISVVPLIIWYTNKRNDNSSWCLESFKASSDVVEMFTVEGNKRRHDVKSCVHVLLCSESATQTFHQAAENHSPTDQLAPTYIEWHSLVSHGHYWTLTYIATKLCMINIDEKECYHKTN